MKNKFMFVKGNEIKRPTYVMKREFSCNDFDNVYYRIGDETLDNIFNSYNVPYRYQKIVFKFNSFFSNNLIEDYITKTGYDIIDAKRSNDKLYIAANTKSYDRYFFETSISSFANYEEVLSFYKELKKSGILKEYVTAINDFYRIENKNIMEDDDLNKLELKK